MKILKEETVLAIASLLAVISMFLVKPNVGYVEYIYVGNLQFMFASANVINMYLRIRNEIYTMDLIPFTLIGLVCIMVGKSIGLRILDKLDTERIKTMVYAFVGITGVVSVLQNLF